MSRILLSITTIAALFVSASIANAQSTCPKNEIMIFGSAYGYSAMVCNKNGKDCAPAPSGAILFYGQKVTKTGCGDAAACDTCKTPLAKMDSAKAEKKNWVYRGRQIFLDTTNGVSKLKSLGFARVTEEKADTYFAIFEIRVAYKMNDQTKYYLTPVAIQLIGNPGIPGILEATQKMANSAPVLEVMDTKSKKTKNYNVAVQAGNHGVILQPLSVFKDQDPMPDAAGSDTKGSATKGSATKPAAGSGTKPTPAGSATKPAAGSTTKGAAGSATKPAAGSGKR